MKIMENLKHVLIRSYASGVHFGLLASERDTPQGLEVTLVNSRRIHYWEGAASCSQIAMDGVSSSSRISIEVPEIRVSNVIEIIPLSSDAITNLQNQAVWKV